MMDTSPLLQRGRARLGIASLSARLLATLFAALGWQATAQACEPPACEPVWALPSEGTVPANAQAFVLNASSPVEASMDELSAGLLMPLEVERVGERLLLSTALKLGSSYQVRLRSACDGSVWNGKFTASKPAPLPRDLGRLVAVQPQPGALQLAHRGGSCSQAARVFYVDVAVELSEAALPWADLFRFETWVDGKRWAPRAALFEPERMGGSWLGRGRDRLYASCTKDSLFAEPGLSAGQHVVQLRATLPGMNEALATPEVRVMLACPEAGDVFRGQRQDHWLEWSLVALVVLAVLGFMLLRRPRRIHETDE